MTTPRRSPQSSRRFARSKRVPPLRNDLIVLFTDGEELGLLGAKGFVETYPALRDIKVTLNFDMRGDYGPSSDVPDQCAQLVAGRSVCSRGAISARKLGSVIVSQIR